MIPADRLEELHEAVYKVMYDGGAVFDRDTVVPAVIDAVLDVVTPRTVLLDAAADVDELDRIAKTPKRDVTDVEFVHLTGSGLFSLTLTRADFSRYLRDRASRAND